MAKLPARFPEIYRDFFSQCTKVASASHSFFWFGDLAGLWGGKTLLQKTPIRFYVGLQPIDKNSFEIEPEFSAYNRATDQFETTRFDQFLVKRLQKLELKGWRLRFLSEISIGVSLGAVGALSASLAMLVKPKAKEDEVFKKAWEISRLLQDNKSSGATAYAALVEGSGPIFFRSDYPKFSGQLLATEPVWPIDIALIFSGKVVKGVSVLQSIEAAKDQLINGGWQSYLNMLDLVTDEGIKSLRAVLKKGADEGAIERLFNLINQYQNLLHFINISTQQLDEIYSNVHQLANKSQNQVGSGAKLTGIGKGGEMLVALPFGQHRGQLEDWLKQTGYSLDYASWRDGFESDGARIEQDIEAGLKSDFLKGDLVTVHTWQDGRKQLSLQEYTKVKPNSFDLLLDQITNKVYIQGKPVNSKKLPSQKAVVTILGKLLLTNGWQLKNSEIPLSTYANSRYDLHGKVVIPFTRAINHSAADFRLKLTGGLYDDYTLKLEANRLKTGLIKRL